MINQRMLMELKSLGIREDDTILVHSSLSSLGYVEGGADTVIDTLLAALPEGTLLIPTLSYSYVTDDEPIFSVTETPSCVGCISETFRKRKGVMRSMHPTHSVCGIGRYAEEILSQHQDADSPGGKKTPFYLLPKYHGKILMLGCGLKPNTSMHAVEELTEPWYLFREKEVTYTLIDETGKKIIKDYRRHDFRGAVQRYDRLAEVMKLACRKVLEADCYLIDAIEMWQVADKHIKENENYFIDDVR